MKKILVIQTAFIGDVILATALIEKLHVYYPDAHIDFLLRKGNEGLLKDHPYLQEVLIWDKKNGKYKNLFKLLKNIRATKYDLVVNVQRFAATGLLTAFSKAKVTIGFDKNPWSFLFSKKVKHIISTPEHPLHEIERNQELIASLTDNTSAKPRLYPNFSDFSAVEKYKSQKYICIAPASVWFTKQFPKEKWVEFISSLSDQSIYLLGGKDDYRLCEDIIAQSSKTNKITNLAGELSFLQSAALQKDALMNYVNDSAPMHIASSMNAPTAAIYCSTIPSFGFGPLSDKRFIIETKENLDCKPCGLHGHKQCPQGHFKCALTIQKEQLSSLLS
ncbi:MAG: heptosyltransferase [Pseudopedobacter saltans]|uniref:Heptosyltransferase n=1 Tax=Pseudopedobacter saltans TaxID=151895 RepID=A0A2W5ER93_9SPHI|nr:MAG: heptosyltransferase [Pseudopedobacter saltans]